MSVGSHILLIKLYYFNWIEIVVSFFSFLLLFFLFLIQTLLDHFYLNFLLSNIDCRNSLAFISSSNIFTSSLLISMVHIFSFTSYLLYILLCLLYTQSALPFGLQQKCFLFILFIFYISILISFATFCLFLSLIVWYYTFQQTFD